MVNEQHTNVVQFSGPEKFWDLISASQYAIHVVSLSVAETQRTLADVPSLECGRVV